MSIIPPQCTKVLASWNLAGSTRCPCLRRVCLGRSRKFHLDTLSSALALYLLKTILADISCLDFKFIMKLKDRTSIFVLICAIFLSPTWAARCFQCRSRGPLGDCRDPFYLTGNSTTLEHKSHGVKTASCSSGWCSKLLEDVDKSFRLDESYGGATQRECLTRPPTDNNERCAFVKLNHKEVYMCFCRGDLCNAALQVPSISVKLLVVPFLLTTLFYLQ